MLKKITYILLILVIPLGLSAQERKVQNRPYIDYRLLHYGFFVGLHTQDIELVNNGFITENGESWYADVKNYTPGLTVGVLAELRMTTHFALRLMPTMHFGQSELTFREQGSGEISRQQLKTTYIATPLHLKCSAERFNNYRPYITMGVSPMVNLTVKKQQQMLVKRFDAMIEVGFGCDFYLPFFKLIPELKFAFSPLDILQKERKDLLDANMLKFTNSLDRASSKMITLTFYFE